MANNFPTARTSPVCSAESHAALKKSPAWFALPVRGIVDYGRGALIMRNCHCRSSIFAAIETVAVCDSTLSWSMDVA